MQFLTRALEIKEEIIQNRRYLHQNAEVGFNLPLTTAYVWDRLTQMGYQPEACGESGIKASVGRGTKNILLRADMDALPMQEDTGLPFASTTGNMHACGHDMHTAMLLGAAKLLKDVENELAGRVTLMFQPAEEILAGAKSMIAAGILENPPVNAAMGMHMMPMVKTGAVLYNIGSVSASSDHIYIRIQGIGGHGAQPNLTVDPINIAAHTHIALQELISREVDPSESVVLSFGSLQAGDANNIIPDTALLRGSLRTYNEETRRFMLERIEQIAKHTAEAFRGSAALEVPASTGSVVVDAHVAEVVTDGLREILGEHGVIQMDQRASESEDFSEVSLRVPSIFVMLGGGAQEDGYTIGLHNPQVRFDEDALPIGAAAYAQGAVALIEDGSPALEARTETVVREVSVSNKAQSSNTISWEDFPTR